MSCRELSIFTAEGAEGRGEAPLRTSAFSAVHHPMHCSHLNARIVSHDA
jgi:hypothetical protein